MKEKQKSQTGLELHEGYGQSETVVICANPKGTKIKSGSMGKASPPYDVQDNLKKTASSERGDFYITGDRAHVDEDGYFWFLGRNDGVINSSSYRIGSIEVESALAEHPAVRGSSAVSSPDPTRGEVVEAFIGLSPAYSSHDPEKQTQKLQEHVKRVTAPYKYPGKSQGDLCFRTAKDSFWKDPEE